MTKEPSLNELIRWTEYMQSVSRDSVDHLRLYEDACKYVDGQHWCKSVEEVYVGFIHPGIVAVFLFKIEPSEPGVDRWTWVIVGDLPPAYIAAEDCLTPSLALDGYIGEMDEWVRAVEQGEPTHDLIPVSGPSTPEAAERLRVRLDFLYEKILPLHETDRAITQHEAE